MPECATTRSESAFADSTRCTGITRKNALKLVPSLRDSAFTFISQRLRAGLFKFRRCAAGDEYFLCTSCQLWFAKGSAKQLRRIRPMAVIRECRRIFSRAFMPRKIRAERLSCLSPAFSKLVIFCAEKL